VLEKCQIILRKKNPSQGNLFERFMTVQKMKSPVKTFARLKFPKGYEKRRLVAVD